MNQLEGRSPPPPEAPPTDIYDADYYERQLHRDHWFLNSESKRALRWNAVCRMIRPSRLDAVLDIGCAAGDHTRRMAPLVGKVIGVDSSPAAIDAATARSAGVDNVEFLHDDARMLARIRDEQVDKAMAIDVVEHVDDADLEQVLIAAWRVLRPGGRLAIYTPCATHYVERLKAHNRVLKQIPGHIAVRTPAALDASLARTPWQIDDRFFLPSSYPVFGTLDRCLGRVPGLAHLFQFRYCVAAIKVVTR